LTLPVASINPERLATVQLGNEEFIVDRTLVPDPPAKHFSSNIPGLFEEWHQSNSLVVNGHGIPIKYWPEFYQAKKGFKSGAWKAIRVEWGNWKVSHFFGHLYLSLVYPPQTAHETPSSLSKSVKGTQLIIFSGPNSAVQRANTLASNKFLPLSSMNERHGMLRVQPTQNSFSMETLDTQTPRACSTIH